MTKKFKQAATAVSQSPTERFFREVLPKHGYPAREGQIALATAVEQALAEGQRLIAEAPTGIGKSIAYLVPAIQRVRGATPRERVVVATGGITLQEQLVKKDLPALSKIMGAPAFTFALLKGLNNYACPKKVARAGGGEGDEEAAGRKKSARSGKGKTVAPHDAQILAWARETETGDRSELPFEPNPHAWARYSSTSDECTGRSCKYAKTCFALRARGRARSADVIVTNYHLLCAHVVSGGNVLPDYEYLVCDEFHKLADVARDCFGWEVREGSARRAAARLKDVQGHNLAIEVAEAAAKFFEELTDHMLSTEYRKRLRREDAAPSWRGLTSSLKKTACAYERAGGFGPNEDDADFDGPGRKGDVEATDAEVTAELKAAHRQTVRLAGRIEAAMQLAGATENVYYLEDDGAGRAVLCQRPVRVAEELHGALFGDDALGAVIATSATLTTGISNGRPDFSYVLRETGLDLADADLRRDLAVPSPFDLDNQLLLVIPSTMPLPKGVDAGPYAEAVAEHVAQAIEYARGRTLALFTSYRVLEAAYSRAVAKHLPYRIMKQGDLPRSKLLEAFKTDTSSCLLATASFWEGVDAPGETLSCVVLDKLPFPHLDDPILDAVTAADPQGSFMGWSVPRATIAFKQGFGRLIRSVADRGVVVVLDQRIITARYGQKFIEAVGVEAVSQRMVDIRNFLG